SSNRHSSARVATSENTEKFVQMPSQVAPSGSGSPGQISCDIDDTYAMQKQIAAAACGVVLVAVAWTAVARGADAPVWNPRAAASYLDQRTDWWTTWPGAARDHETFCVSCHTAAPYAVARPVLRRMLGEPAPSAPEAKLI